MIPLDMQTEVGILLIYAFVILGLYLIGYFLLVPARFLLKLVGNSILGGLALLLINWIGGFWDFHIPLNLLSCVVVGILGIPGLILLIIF